MTRSLARRLQKLEVRSATATHIHSHLLCFVNPQRQIVSTALVESGKPFVWNHLRDPEPWTDTTIVKEANRSYQEQNR